VFPCGIDSPLTVCPEDTIGSNDMAASPELA
jgi:hypothetical protein